LVFDAQVGADGFDANAFANKIAGLAEVNDTWVNVNGELAGASKRALNLYDVSFFIKPPHKKFAHFGN
jgi:hypothetical protein